MSGNGITVKRGGLITIDGAAGKVFKGAVKMLDAERTGDLAILMQWAEDVRQGPDHPQPAKNAD